MFVVSFFKHILITNLSKYISLFYPSSICSLFSILCLVLWLFLFDSLSLLAVFIQYLDNGLNAYKIKKMKVKYRLKENLLDNNKELLIQMETTIWRQHGVCIKEIQKSERINLFSQCSSNYHTWNLSNLKT